jgi:membrane-bound lytic murein transglycosylase D
VKAGEKLEQIASKFGIDLAALRSANGIGPRQRVVGGHTLLVPKGSSAAADTELPALVSQPAFENETRVVRNTYVARKGDSLVLIANRYKVTLATLKSWNPALGNSVAPGQKLVIESVVQDSPGKTTASGGKYAKAKVAAKHIKRAPLRVARR